MEFYRCKHCGNIIAYVHNSGVPVICCGAEMIKLTENTVDASAEKHVPVIVREGTKIHVAVGAAPHPMEEAHHIAWIALETDCGNQRVILQVGEVPVADFYVAENTRRIKAYAYCNLHGLWSSEI